MYKVRLRKCRATWHWFTENPQGGGFGSNQVSSKRAVWARAIEAIPVGASYELWTNDKFSGQFTKG